MAPNETMMLIIPTVKDEAAKYFIQSIYMIISTPLDIPKIEPDDWNLFWDIWNKHSAPLKKQWVNNGSELDKKDAPVVWTGLDLYDKWPAGTSWRAPLFKAEKLFPKMFKIIFDLNLQKLYRVRVISSIEAINAHSDDSADWWSIRAFLHNPSPKQQWYFTKPFDRFGTRTYLKMSEETNWFAYHDSAVWHGTDYDPKYPKLLLQLYSWPLRTSDDLIQRSISKFSNYTINSDELL